MTISRFYHPSLPPHARLVELPPESAHHAAKVLRLQAGDAIVLFDGTGGEYPALIEQIGKQRVTVEIGTWRERECESPLDVTLVQALSSGDKMDFTLQKAVELGITAIQPIASERSVVKLSGERAEKRVRHWQQIVVSACEQCGRNRVPQVAPILSLNDWLGQAAKPGVRLTLAPDAPASLRELPRPSAPVTLLIGPEGGFAPSEIKAAASCGFAPVRLGPRVLRTETAALAALAAMQAVWGDF
ncbi:ribosomal RNA small subunit methyltransferase E [Sulfurimicrobium lacus]|uniref:Ribosomal RNA small subunit methyltransferase E n=1 Tax=Sulfurimicrobium lacus TaxID=2715678 RepID=A0A6F8VHW4_9PROT|nr:16S rRNA (uracil(1498)-N(3))-methyltransferase [Sulfurimicrobium lacus]BCB28687.1 ribosomal RNA small subunit methyltransferase E [Sulfurimicrobium lacus]